MSKKVEYVRFKSYERKIKSTLLIYVLFESILVPQDNGKQNLHEPYTNKYQKLVSCSYVYKLVWVDDKFSKPFKSYLGKDAAYNLINSILEESKYCSHLMKKHFNKELLMSKMDLENSTKCSICDNDYDDGGLNVRNHCHITGKYRGSSQRDCNIKVKLNHRFSVVFQNLKNYGPHLIMQEVGKFDCKINIIPNGLEKYMSFNSNNNLIFIDSFEFLSSSLDR